MAALVAELAAEAAKGPPYVPDKPVQPYEF